jgi:hypothetical protein
MREGQLGSKLAAYLRGHNALVIPQVVARHGKAVMSHRGVSDKYIVHNYWNGWAELKAEGETLKQEQLDFVSQVVARGGNACGIQFQAKEWLQGQTKLRVWQFKSYEDYDALQFVYYDYMTDAANLLSHLKEVHEKMPPGLCLFLSEYPVSK